LPVKFHKILEYPKDKKGNSTPGQFILAIAVLLMGIILSLYYFHSVKSHVNSDLNNKFSHQIHLTTSILDLKLEQYTNLVSGGEGLFNIGAVSSQQQWLSYFQTYNLLKQYPGVVAVSYSQYVNQSELPSFVSQAQTEVTPSYKVYPAGTRPIYAPVKYIAYVFPQSQRTYGYDVLTNPQRAAAVNKAMVSGKPIMSGKISLKSTDIGKPAFVIYAPVYSKPSSTLAERRQNIEGFVFVATSASGLINNVMAQLQNNAFAFEIYDGNNTSKASSLMYKSNNFDATYDNHLRQKALPFIFDGHEWSIQAVASKALLPSSETQSPAYSWLALLLVLFSPF
jgi:CHASE1-domain containing sensor protein